MTTANGYGVSLDVLRRVWEAMSTRPAPVRVVARRLGISHSQTRHALECLCAAGYLAHEHKRKVYEVVVPMLYGRVAAPAHPGLAGGEAD